MIDLSKKFLIYGFGISGKSISRYLHNKNSYYKIYDDNLVLSNIKNIIRKNTLIKNLKNFDYFVVSPSIKINKKHLLFPFKNKILIDLDFLSLELNDQTIIGVTGTEGKSTTCQYLFQNLYKKYKSTIIGNFGNTILEKKNIYNYLKNLEIIIIELSSYQLDKIKYLKLDHALITNISPDHLNYHESYNNYIKSKFSIQSILKKSGFFYIRNEDFRSYNHLIKFENNRIIKIKIGKINGSFINKIRLLNVPMISSVLKKIDFKISFNKSILKDLPFRNQLIKNENNLKIYNDSKCTNLENAIMKNKFLNNNKILILGGKPKIHPKKLMINDSLILIFGHHSTTIIKNLTFYNSKYFIFKNLIDVLQFIKIINFDYKFKHILFSPGGESFDQFKDFHHRGRAFNTMIKRLKF